VTEVVFAGSDSRALVDIGSERRFTVRTLRRATPARGEQVGITWDVDDSSVLV